DWQVIGGTAIDIIAVANGHGIKNKGDCRGSQENREDSLRCLPVEAEISWLKAAFEDSAQTKPGQFAAGDKGCNRGSADFFEIEMQLDHFQQPLVGKDAVGKDALEFKGL